MISLLTMVVNAICSAFIYAIKAFFSLVNWFLKRCQKAVKILYAILPVTCIVFILLFAVNTVLMIGSFLKGPDPITKIDIPEGIVSDQQVEEQTQRLILNGNRQVSNMVFQLKNWWMESIYIYHGQLAYIPLLILTILMFIPVMAVILCITVIFSYSNLLFLAVVADTALYIIRAVLGKNFFEQFQGRYYKVFPDAGKRHYEKNYDRWLRNKNREIEEEERENRRRRHDDFYEENEDVYDDYDPEYEDEYDEEYDEDYEDEYYEEEDYEEEYDDYDEIEDNYEDDPEEDYDEPEEDFEDDYDAPTPKGPTTTFNFFAGCTSRESVDRKYKSLVKLYHPDNMDGDTAALQEINIQYSEAKKRFG